MVALFSRPKSTAGPVEPLDVLRELPVPQRVASVLHHSHWPDEAIARLLDVTPADVRSLTHAAEAHILAVLRRSVP